MVNNQPQRVMDERNGMGAQGGYIAKYVLICVDGVVSVIVFMSSYNNYNNKIHRNPNVL